MERTKTLRAARDGGPRVEASRGKIGATRSITAEADESPDKTVAGGQEAHGSAGGKFCKHLRTNSKSTGDTKLASTVRGGGEK